MPPDRKIMEFPLEWGKKRKRNCYFTPEDYEAADTLLMLAAMPPREANAPPPETPIETLNCNNSPQPEFQTETFKCQCGKEFSSYQALGGHKTTHREKPNPKKSKLSAPAAIREPAVFGESTTSSEKVNEEIHERGTCGKCFSSGQSLGGHMRRHYAWPIGGKINGGNSLKPIISTYPSIENQDERSPPVFRFKIKVPSPGITDLRLGLGLPMDVH